MNTPAYIFSERQFCNTVSAAKNLLGVHIPLCYSIKANPFLLQCVPDDISMLEVCSPGELSICESLHIAPDRIIYSGVMKELSDIRRAVAYDVGILTAESPLQLELENQACKELNKNKDVLLRLSSGNQFGMSEETLLNQFAKRSQYTNLNFIGLHYYSGTQKKLKAIEKDLAYLENILEKLKNEFQFSPVLVEYGPGAFVDYFYSEKEDSSWDLFSNAVDCILAFSKKYPIGIEMGRFLAAPCGQFITQVKDLKTTKGTNYAICDGGIHHLSYYGQTMAMKIPPIATSSTMDKLIAPSDQVSTIDSSATTQSYCLCGSLCTVADVLVRELCLPPLQIGDYIAFRKCGAYSVTEGASLFLSRTMPEIYLERKSGTLELLRDAKASYSLNMADYMNLNNEETLS